MSAANPLLTLRDLTEDDLDWVALQEEKIFGAGAWSMSLIRDDFRYGTSRYRGAERGGDLVAYAVYGFDGDAFTLMNIAVTADARGTRVGSALMDDFFAQAKAMHAHKVWLEVAVTNASAISLYERYGFEQVRVRKRYYQPGDVDAVVMCAAVP